MSHRDDEQDRLYIAVRFQNVRKRRIQARCRNVLKMIAKFIRKEI
jgi:hypothetical protein